MRALKHPASGWRASFRLRVLLAMVLLPAPGLLPPLSGLQTPHTPSPDGQQLGGLPASNMDDDPVEQEKRLKALNAERQKSLVADTNRLVKLATDLNGELNGTHPESLNPEQLRKVAEIEKLAKSVREKMSMSVKGIPVFGPIPASIR